MGRPSEGWKLRWKRGRAYCRFTWQGREHSICLFTSDKRQAQEAAPRAYAEVVNGVRRPIRRAPGQILDLEQLLEAWLESKRTSIDPSFAPTLDGYAARFLDTFETLDRITEASAANFGLARLAQAQRTTVIRELAYLRQFLEWCRLEGALIQTPIVPKLPPKAQGTRTGTQRSKAVHISPTEAEAILKLLPEQSKTIDGRKWPLRARFAFMWETALRPNTLSRLSVPDNWRPGLAHLELMNRDDKARFGRVVDLTPAAVRILIQAAPERGLVFGRHCFYKALKRAAIEVLGAERGKLFAPYDFRHGRAKQVLDAHAPIRGVSYMLGHKRVTTTDKYLAPERSAGQAALKAVSGRFSARKRRAKRGTPKK